MRESTFLAKGSACTEAKVWGRFPTYLGTDKPKMIKLWKWTKVHLSWREGNEKKKEKKWERKLREKGRKAGMFVVTAGNRTVLRRKE